MATEVDYVTQRPRSPNQQYTQLTEQQIKNISKLFLHFARERTCSHFYGESIDRYTTIDMYRSNPTNVPGPVTMDSGRPSDGYYAQKYPARTTWVHSTVPLNRQGILDMVYKKTFADYEENQRESRKGWWPEYSEYTSKHLLHTPTPPHVNNLMEKKRQLKAA